MGIDEQNMHLLLWCGAQRVHVLVLFVVTIMLTVYCN